MPLQLVVKKWKLGKSGTFGMLPGEATEGHTVPPWLKTRVCASIAARFRDVRAQADLLKEAALAHIEFRS